jgi:hypothetical protein
MKTKLYAKVLGVVRRSMFGDMFSEIKHYDRLKWRKLMSGLRHGETVLITVERIDPETSAQELRV